MGFDPISALLGVGNFGLALYGTFAQQSAFRMQERHYQEQAAINRRIGAFNAAICEQSGVEAIHSIAKQTRSALGKAITVFSNRGISMEGSPMMILGEIETMGEAKAQSEYFNSQVNKINAQYGVQQAVSNAMSRAEQAKFGQLSSMIDSFKTLGQGYDMFKSMYNNYTASNTPGMATNSTLNSIVADKFRG